MYTRPMVHVFIHIGILKQADVYNRYEEMYIEEWHRSNGMFNELILSGVGGFTVCRVCSRHSGGVPDMSSEV